MGMGFVDPSSYQFLGPNNSDVTTKQNVTQSTSLVFDPNAKANLDAALNDPNYSKDAATKDSKGAATWTMQQIFQQLLPGVETAAKAAGGYNSTTQQLMRDDVTARASAAGQNVLLDTIQKYAQIKQGNIQAATGAVQATTGNVVTTTGTIKQENRSAGALWDLSHPSAIAGARWSDQGQSGGGTVICTQLLADGHMHPQVYNADIQYVTKNFCWDTVNGYRFLGVPFVKLMRKNKAAYAVGKYLGLKWAHHVAGVERSLVITLVSPFATLLCYTIGNCIKPVNYAQLWEA